MSKYNEHVEALLAQQAKGKSVNFRIVEAGLKQKLQEGTIEQQDVVIAMQVARALGSTESKVLYTYVKRAAQQEQTE
ncbi:hypothetical protein FH508_0012445 [Lysinibacillus sp. CD3-6]|uniref:hypothetical protein n=1 Tax=Lysinibacillus sp. CD3-6 TaxID=2892541 RepID=UPI00116FAB99|nr:hypothetical protein [Lysinibacillus sp. CD3-6]UED78277.1 hypothetical protein FH508_0012445 [Lysinibacillus sp. CD3-6]